MVIAVILKIREKHSVFFIQERIGRHKKPFSILKFQTMVNGVPTKTGKILRKTGLDEWPQFINVLKGDMSIVGPRALTQEDIERLGWDIDYYASRWNIRPGISGYAQLYGGQGKKISWFWDKQYAQSNNVFLDFGVLVASFMINIFGKERIQKILRG